MGEIILPSDFIKTGDHRDSWRAGYMRHVVAALNERRVAVVTDNMTGHLAHPVSLLRVSGRSSGYGYSVLVRRHWFGDAPGSDDVWVSLFKVGAVISLEATAFPKWDALRSCREEESQAVKIAQERHGEPEGRSWGKWSPEPLAEQGCVYVTYDPHMGNPAFADRWGTPWSGTIRV